MIMRHLPRIWNKKGLPIHIIYHFSYRCNSRCKSCFLWKETEAENKGRELEVDEIRLIRKSLGNILWLQIGGGEPFLRQDLPEVCNAFGDIDTIAIPTNCIEPEQIECKVHEILKNVTSRLFLVLSLDGFEDTHDEIRSFKGNFKRVLETYQRVDKLRNKYPNFKISVNTVIMEKNKNEIIKLIDYAKKVLSLDMHSFEFLRGQPRSNDFSLPNAIKCAELTPAIKDCIRYYSYGGGWRGKLLQKAKFHEQDLILKTLQDNKKQINCFAGQLSAVINPYGEVFACEMINEKIGSLRDYGYNFKKLWSSQEAENVRKKVKDCFCSHSCFYLLNSLFNSSVLTKVLLS